MKKTKTLAAAAVCTCLMGVMPVFASGTGSAADKLLEDVTGTYDELFTVVCDPQYDQLWLDDCAAIVGGEMAQPCAEMLKAACTATIYGEEAAQAYAEKPDEAQFDCFFINGVKQFVFEGNHICGLDEDGETVFGYDYEYAQDLSIGGMMDGYLYETDAQDAGEFRYFLLFPDTPDSTYHIEFRYGSDVDALSQYNEGPYAYWLAAGILTDCDQEMVENCIHLFVEENLAETEGEENGGQSEEQTETEVAFAGGTGTEEDPWQIATAQQLDLVHSDLTAHYVLTRDIDLSGFENWEPIGSFRPLSDAPEDAEVPHPDYAFTGTFDGNGNTISNLTVASEVPMGAGLFGCVLGTEDKPAYIRNFTLENVNVSGGYLVGGAVGLQFMNCPVSDITLTGSNALSGMQGIGGIVGTGFDLISNCSATADITVLGDDGACAGIIVGGTTMSPIKDCAAVGGSITAEGNNTWGFGSVCGAPWGAPEISGCMAVGTTITVSGEENRLIGGLVGFGGSYDETDPAQITGCQVEDVIINSSDSTDSIGGLIGGGKEMMEGSEVMSSFEIKECSVSGSITGGREHVGAVVGDPACAVSIDCEGGMKTQNTETVQAADAMKNVTGNDEAA